LPSPACLWPKTSAAIRGLDLYLYQKVFRQKDDSTLFPPAQHNTPCRHLSLALLHKDLFRQNLAS
jgi:hypothetical protein